jgi:TolC family type I secretion outer membrane protein
MWRNRGFYSTGTFLAGAALAALVGGAPAGAQTLQEALSEAYANNPTLQAQRAAVRATDEGVPQAKSGWRPSVQLTGELSGLRDRSSLTTGRRESTRTTSNVQLSITQNLYDGGGTQAAVAGAEADVLAARADLATTEQIVLLDVVTAYMNVLRDEAVVDLRAQNTVRLDRQLEATRDRFNAGVATLTDVAQSESRLARARSDLLSAEGDLAVSRAVFEQVVGIPAGELSPPGLEPALPAGRDEAKQMAVERNPSVQAALFARRAALHAIDEQMADLLPDVDLSASARRQWDEQGRGTQGTTLELSALLTVPIYQQGFETSEVRQSKMTAAQAAQQIEEARRDALEEALSAWESYGAVVATITAIREEVRAAEIALEGVREEELVGQRTVLEVLDAEQELLDANVSLAQAQRDEIVARFELVAAVGSLTARDLGLDVGVYDPSQHYRAVEGQWWGLGGPVAPEPTDVETRAVQP